MIHLWVIFFNPVPVLPRTPPGWSCHKVSIMGLFSFMCTTNHREEWHVTWHRSSLWLAVHRKEYRTHVWNFMAKMWGPSRDVLSKISISLIRLFFGGKFSDNPERTDYFINCWCWFHHFHYDNCKKINYNHQKMYKAMVRKALLSIL